MRNVILKLLIVSAALLVGSTSCKKNKEDDIPQGKETSFKLTIAQPNVYAKLATTKDENALANETKFETVDVYIYNFNTNVLENHSRLNGSTDFTPEDVGNGIYVSSTAIPALTGKKKIYVGVNLSAALSNQIKMNGPASVKSIDTVHDVIDGGTNSGFSMFNTTASITTLVENPEDEANKINVNVKRLVVKVTVQEGSGVDYNVSGGALSSLVYNVHNINKRFFPLQFTDVSIIKDPNWESQAAGIIQAADFYNAPVGEYIPVNDRSISVTKSLIPRYMMENTSQNQFADELSYVIIRADFKPSDVLYYINGSNASGGIGVQANASPVATFYRLSLTNGEVYYSLSETMAVEYAGIKGDVSYTLDTYNNGHCYYLVYLNRDKKYSIYRNDFYKTTITAINGLGNPTPDNNGHVPLESLTQITVTVNIVDWNLIDYETTLPGSK